MAKHRRGDSHSRVPFAILFCARRLCVFCAFSASRLGLRGIPVVSTGASRSAFWTPVKSLGLPPPEMILRDKGRAILCFALDQPPTLQPTTQPTKATALLRS